MRSTGPLRVRLRPRHRELGLGERGPLLGQPLGAEHPLCYPQELRRRRLRPPPAAEERPQLAPAEAVLGRAGAPVLAEACKIDVLLALAGVDGGDLGGVEADGAALAETLDDLKPAPGELVDHRPRHGPKLGPALRRRLPAEAERAGKLVAQVRLIQVAGGKPVGLEDRLAVEPPPLAVARAAGHVGHDHVRVQVRVLGAHSNALRTSAPLARRHDRREPRSRPGRDQLCHEWCTFRLQIPVQYWTARVTFLGRRLRTSVREILPT